MSSAKSRFKALIVAAVLLLTTTAVSSTYAGRYELITKDDPTESYQFSDSEGVCVAFDKNLKKFADRPYGMACKRELDPALGFTRPTWERLNILDHLDLALAIIQFSNWDKYVLQPDPRPWPERIKEMVEKDKLTMDIVRLDLNLDGKPDNLVRFGFDGPCDPAGKLLPGSRGRVGGHRGLYVVDTGLTKVEPYSDYIGVAKEDVFLFKGNVYTDLFEAMPLSVRSLKKRDGTFFLVMFFKYGAAGICKFHYHENNSPKGGKAP